MGSVTKIVFFSRPKSLKNRLVSLFTRCPFYHVGILQSDSMEMFDMYFMRRRRTWADVKLDNRHDNMLFAIVDSPVEIPTSYLKYKILEQNDRYGFEDLLLFAVRPLFHLLGKSTRNSGGIICSEMVNLDLKSNDSPPLQWPCAHVEVDSPCDIWRHLCELKMPVAYEFGPGVSAAEKAEYMSLAKVG